MQSFVFRVGHCAMPKDHAGVKFRYLGLPSASNPRSYIHMKNTVQFMDTFSDVVVYGRTSRHAVQIPTEGQQVPAGSSKASQMVPIPPMQQTMPVCDYSAQNEISRLTKQLGDLRLELDTNAALLKAKNENVSESQQSEETQSMIENLEKLKTDLETANQSIGELNKTIAQLKNEKKAFEKELQTLPDSDQMIDANGEIEAIRCTLQSRQNTIEENQRIIEKNGEQISQLTLELNSLKEQLNNGEATFRKLQSELDVANRQKNELEQSVGELNTTIQNIRTEQQRISAQKQQEFNTINANYQGAETEKLATINKLNGQIEQGNMLLAQSNGEVQRLKAELSALQEQIANSSGANTTLTNQLADLNLEKQRLLKEIETRGAAIDSLNEEKRRFNSDIVNLSSTRDALKSQIEELEQKQGEQIANYEEKIQVLENRLAEESKVIAKLEMEKKGFETTASKVEVGISNLTQQLQQSESRLALKNQEYAELQTTLNASENLVKEQADLLVALQGEIERLRPQVLSTEEILRLQGFETRNAELVDNLQAKEKEWANVRSSLTAQKKLNGQLEDFKNKLEAQLEETKNQVARRDGAIKQWQTSNGKLKKKIKEKGVEIARLKSELETKEQGFKERLNVELQNAYQQIQDLQALIQNPQRRYFDLLNASERKIQELEQMSQKRRKGTIAEKLTEFGSFSSQPSSTPRGFVNVGNTPPSILPFIPTNLPPPNLTQTPFGPTVPIDVNPPRQNTSLESSGQPTASQMNFEQNVNQ